MSIHKKIQTFKNINQKITSLNVLQDFMNFAMTVFSASLAGGICGLLGSGGGIVLLMMLRRLDPDHPRACFATCVTVTIGLALMTVWQYHQKDILNLTAAMPLVFPACAGGILGAKLLGKIDVKWLGRLFSVICLIGGIRMLFW